jgi:3-oxoacyl-[acyl-carrier-protein] synthase II
VTYLVAAVDLDERKGVSEMQRVVVTGVGAVSPLGADVPTLWAGLLNGRSGVRALTEAWAADLPVSIAAPVTLDPATVLGSQRCRRLDPVQQLALIAAIEAWADAGSPDVEPDRLAVVIGSGIGGLSTTLEQHQNLGARGARGVAPQSMTMCLPDGPAVAVGLELGAQAGVHTPVSACASGAEAIALGLDLIRADRADVVVCGGAESAVHPLTLAGFAALRALSSRNDDPAGASRPFDRDRDGFVLGEGAAVVVLESQTYARRRQGAAYAELLGAGVSSDAYHPVAPSPDGRGSARAMVGALRQASADPAAVVHVNAHATSTPLGDAAEAAAIRTLLGQRADVVAVTATKSMTGHLLGASGALAAIITAISTSEQTAPPTINHRNPDDGLGLDLVRHAPRSLGRGVALSNSFGFGGHNVCLALRQPDEDLARSLTQVAAPRAA